MKSEYVVEFQRTSSQEVRVIAETLIDAVEAAIPLALDAGMIPKTVSNMTTGEWDDIAGFCVHCHRPALRGENITASGILEGGDIFLHDDCKAQFLSDQGDSEVLFGADVKNAIVRGF